MYKQHSVKLCAFSCSQEEEVRAGREAEGSARPGHLAAKQQHLLADAVGVLHQKLGVCRPRRSWASRSAASWRRMQRHGCGIASSRAPSRT